MNLGSHYLESSDEDGEGFQRRRMKMKKNSIYFCVSVVILAVSMIASWFLKDDTILIYTGFVIVFANQLLR
jgi:hypothetical protein